MICTPCAYLRANPVGPGYEEDIAAMMSQGMSLNQDGPKPGRDPRRCPICNHTARFTHCTCLVTPCPIPTGLGSEETVEDSTLSP